MFTSRSNRPRPRRVAPASPPRCIVEGLEGRTLFTTLPAGFAESAFGGGLNRPTAMEFAPDGRLFVAEQGSGGVARLRVIKNGALLPTPFLTLNVDNAGERGLVGLTLDPNFAANRFVYVYYTTNAGGFLHNRISRFTASGDVAATGSERVIFELDPLGTATNHNGGALHFGRDGKLYVGVGENAFPPHAQNLANLHGKMLRLNADGSIPTDNPFYNTAAGKNRAIWALGLRNPFTFTVQPSTGRMFINDVGQSTWEEVNEGAAGANYGWPTTEGPTSDPRFRAPLYAYDHSSSGGRAVIGGAFYEPARSNFPSQYQGDYFFGDHTNGWLRTFDTATRTVTGFATGAGNLVDIDLGPDGALYYLRYGSSAPPGSGQVMRITYTASQAPSIGTHPRSQSVSAGQPVTFSVAASGTAPLRYQWQRNGVNIAGATGSSYTLASATLSDNGATFRAVVSNGFGSATSNSATLTVASNRAPTASISFPASGSRYRGGQTISYSGNGSDPEDGTLPAANFSWSVVFHHADHSHPFLGPVTGVKSGTFTIPNTGEISDKVFYRVHLTVRDSKGATHTTFRDIHPQRQWFRVRSSVAGLNVLVDGTPYKTEYVDEGVVGIRRTLSAPSTQTLNGVTYQFAGWSDGGAQTHTIGTPSVETVYTATYQPVGSTRRLSASADAYARDTNFANTNFGRAGTLEVKRVTSTTASVNREAFLRFDLSSVSTIGTARLRLFGRLLTNDSRNIRTGVFSSANTTWTETGLTWNNRPTTGSTPLATVTVTDATARWYEWDLTSYLKAQKAAGKNVVTLVLKNLDVSAPQTTFNSREAGSNRPELVITA